MCTIYSLKTSDFLYIVFLMKQLLLSSFMRLSLICLLHPIKFCFQGDCQMIQKTCGKSMFRINSVSKWYQADKNLFKSRSITLEENHLVFSVILLALNMLRVGLPVPYTIWTASVLVTVVTNWIKSCQLKVISITPRQCIYSGIVFKLKDIINPYNFF